MRFIFLIILVIQCLNSYAQIWVPTPIANMPESVSNNAVCEARVNGVDYMYSFSGIDSTKVYSGIHLKSFKYNLNTDTWSSLPSLPDTLGKIAASASYVKGKIYIIGGYHVYSNGSEKSSYKTHRFDPSTDTYLSDGTDIPFPIDDQVQCVWRDSLIYVITGWSNTGNVGHVQVYNPSQDTWQQASAVIGGAFQVFGANGIIKNDTIYYYGGANTSTNFPATPILRIGVIDSMNPTSINWLAPKVNASNSLYRLCVLANPDNSISFLGGSKISYNYNGISYATNQGVPPANEQITYNIVNQNFTTNNSHAFPMDLRGYANVSDYTKLICGGMEAGQVVSKKAYRLDFNNALNASNLKGLGAFKIYPNPARDELRVSFLNKMKDVLTYSILDTKGAILLDGVLNKISNKISVEGFAEGTYYLQLSYGKSSSLKTFLIY